MNSTINHRCLYPLFIILLTTTALNTTWASDTNWTQVLTYKPQLTENGKLQCKERNQRLAGLLVRQETWGTSYIHRFNGICRTLLSDGTSGTKKYYTGWGSSPTNPGFATERDTLLCPKDTWVSGVSTVISVGSPIQDVGVTNINLLCTESTSSFSQYGQTNTVSIGPETSDPSGESQSCDNYQLANGISWATGPAALKAVKLHCRGLEEPVMASDAIPYEEQPYPDAFTIYSEQLAVPGWTFGWTTTYLYFEPNEAFSYDVCWQVVGVSGCALGSGTFTADSLYWGDTINRIPIQAHTLYADNEIEFYLTIRSCDFLGHCGYRRAITRVSFFKVCVYDLCDPQTERETGPVTALP